MISLESDTIKECCLTKIKKQWLQANSTFPTFLSAISNETKLQNEQCLQSLSTDFRKQFERFPRLSIRRKKWKKITLKMLMNVLNSETVIGIHQYIHQLSLTTFQDELRAFLIHVRQFAPELTFDGIGQATRNYIVYAMFKHLNQKPAQFNKACFGYSMLYPFTDNYIDSVAFTMEQKLEYNQILRDKIIGKDVYPKSMHQQKTCELLEAIEALYPRDCNTTIFTLLLMMLEAQEDSLCQQNQTHQLTPEERLNISIYKGGISVLIDQFFVDKNLTEMDLDFYLSFGFFLQLVDDLQDIKEDYKQGNQTIFTFNLHCEETEKIVNKMLHFLHHISTSYVAKNDRFMVFLVTNCYQLIYLSVAGSKEFFSKEYLDKIANFTIITHSFLDNYNNNKLMHHDAQKTKRYTRMLDEMLI